MRFFDKFPNLDKNQHCLVKKELEKLPHFRMYTVATERRGKYSNAGVIWIEVGHVNEPLRMGTFFRELKGAVDRLIRRVEYYESLKSISE